MISLQDLDRVKLSLDDITLNPGEWLQIKMLTQKKVVERGRVIEMRGASGGTNRVVTASGHLIGAIGGSGVRPVVSSQPRVTKRVLAVVSVLFFLVGLLVANSIGVLTGFVQGNCAVGSVGVTGSSAFAGDVQRFAQAYQAACPVASITSYPTNSQLGLTDLEAGRYQIASSELAATAQGITDFKDHSVGVIVFVLIVNKGVNVTNLTHDQLLGIFSGKTNNWKDINGQQQEIAIINRTQGSGTYSALRSYVLASLDPLKAPGSVQVERSDEMMQKVATTPGALGYVEEGIALRSTYASQVTTLEIDSKASTPGLVESNSYPFWTIEHMYTKGEQGGLVDSFIRYVQAHLETSDSLVKLGDMQPGVLNTRLRNDQSAMENALL